MALAILFIPISDALVKWLGAELSVGQIAWLRFVLQTLFIASLVFLQRRSVGPIRWWHGVLGLELSGAILFLYWGLQYLPLANNIVIFFAEPLLLLILARLFLGEQVSWQRWVAVGVGLSGVLIVLRPNWSLYGVMAILPLMAALCYAAFMATARAFQRDSAVSPSSLQFWVGVWAILVLGLFLLIGGQQDVALARWSWPELHQWGLLIGIGLLAAFSHVLIAMALSLADASLLAPFQYLEILGASLLGWWIFGEFPDQLTLLGGAVIIGSGIWLFLHERQLARSNLDLVN